MKRVIVCTSCVVLAEGASLAAHVPEVVTPDRLWRSWSFDPVVLLSLAVTIWLYARGVACVWERAGRGRVVSRADVLCFAGAVVALVVALVSPLDSLGGTVLSAHMAQHGLLAGIAPPLLLLSRAGIAFAWALRPVWNVDPMTVKAWRWMTAAARRLSAPVFATVLHAVLLWIWHAPTLFGAAVAYDWVHVLQHVSFFVPSLLFWRALLDVNSRGRAAVSMVAAFLTFMHTGMLGGLLTMAPEALYPSYVGRSGGWGLTPLEDQQFAGLLMWVPLGLPYLVVGVWLASRLLTEDLHTAGRETGS